MTNKKVYLNINTFPLRSENLQLPTVKMSTQIANENQILRQSYGEISDMRTIRYHYGLDKTTHSEGYISGLFCPIIFGGIEKKKLVSSFYRCSDHNHQIYSRLSDVCFLCNQPISSSNSKRSRKRMGHIKLPYPIINIRYINIISLLLFRYNPIKTLTFLSNSIEYYKITRNSFYLGTISQLYLQGNEEDKIALIYEIYNIYLQSINISLFQHFYQCIFNGHSIENKYFRSFLNYKIKYYLSNLTLLTRKKSSYLTLGSEYLTIGRIDQILQKIIIQKIHRCIAFKWIFFSKMDMQIKESYIHLHLEVLYRKRLYIEKLQLEKHDKYMHKREKIFLDFFNIYMKRTSKGIFHNSNYQSLMNPPEIPFIDQILKNILKHIDNTFEIQKKYYQNIRYLSSLSSFNSKYQSTLDEIHTQDISHDSNRNNTKRIKLYKSLDYFIFTKSRKETVNLNTGLGRNTQSYKVSPSDHSSEYKYNIEYKIESHNNLLDETNKRQKPLNRKISFNYQISALVFKRVAFCMYKMRKNLIYYPEYFYNETTLMDLKSEFIFTTSQISILHGSSFYDHIKYRIMRKPIKVVVPECILTSKIKPKQKFTQKDTSSIYHLNDFNSNSVVYPSHHLYEKLSKMKSLYYTLHQYMNRNLELNRPSNFNNFYFIKGGILIVNRNTKQTIEKTQLLKNRMKYHQYKKQAVKDDYSFHHIPKKEEFLRNRLKIEVDILTRKNNQVYLNALYTKRFILFLLIITKQRPESFFMKVIPVLPVDLRPLMRITAEGKQDVFITSDINYLYQSLIRSIIWSQKTRNYKKTFTQSTHQKKNLGKEKTFRNLYYHQQMVYQKISLFDRHDIQVFLWILIDKRRVNKDILEERLFQKNSNKYESIIERLKGKEGQFRNNLLGKRLNYSGRSVITSGPRLQINTCGLPFEMIFGLFKPYIMNKVKSYYNLKAKEKQSSFKESQLKYVKFVSFLKKGGNLLSKDSLRSVPKTVLKLQLKYSLIHNLFHLSPSFSTSLRNILNQDISTRFKKLPANTLFQDLKRYNQMNINKNQKLFRSSTKSYTQSKLQKLRFGKDQNLFLFDNSLYTLNGQRLVGFQNQLIGHKRFQNNSNSYHLPHFKEIVMIDPVKEKSIPCLWHFAIIDSQIERKKFVKLKSRGTGRKDKKILDNKKKKKNQTLCLSYFNQSYLKTSRIRSFIDKQGKSIRSGWYHFLIRYKPLLSFTQIPFKDQVKYRNIYSNSTHNSNKSPFNQYTSKIEPICFIRDFAKYPFLPNRSLITKPTLFSLDSFSTTNNYKYITNQFILENDESRLEIDDFNEIEIGGSKTPSKKIKIDRFLRVISHIDHKCLQKEVDGSAKENNKIIQKTRGTKQCDLTVLPSVDPFFQKRPIHKAIKRRDIKKDRLIRYLFSSLLNHIRREVRLQKKKERSKEYLLHNIACLFSIPLRTQIISILQKIIHTEKSRRLVVQIYENQFRKIENQFVQKRMQQNSSLTRGNLYHTKKSYNEYIKTYLKFKPLSKDKELEYTENARILTAENMVPLLNQKQLPSGDSWLLLEKDQKWKKNQNRYYKFKSHINNEYRKNSFFIPQEYNNLATHSISYMYKELYDLVREHPILLNRAPTLHRFNIQAFSPLLVHTKAIQLHPLVCGSFNADFDGDTMAVHIPLSLESQIESRILMSTSANIIATASSNGNLILTPSQDLVFGLYYATLEAYGDFGECNYYENLNEIKHALSLGIIDIHTQIHYRSFDYHFNDNQMDLKRKQSNFYIAKGKKVISIKETKEINLQYTKPSTQNTSSPSALRIKTTPGRVLLYHLLKGFSMHDKLRFAFRNHVQETNKVFTKKELLTFLSRISNENTELSGVVLSNLLDQLMAFGFYFSYKAGISIHKNDVNIPSLKYLYINKANQILNKINVRNTGKSSEESYKGFIQIWSKCVNSITNHILEDIKHTIPNKRPAIYMLIDSGARGSMVQMRQLSGMRGLMVKPSGEVLNMTIKSNFKEGLSVLEYFNSIHGARKGVIDTALKTATAGYLTRKLVNATKNIYIVKKDCYTNRGILLGDLFSNSKYTKDFIYNSLLGRNILRTIKDPVSNEIILDVNKSDSRLQNLLNLKKISLVQEKEIEFFIVRSVLTCDTDFQFGVCQKCYGFDLSSIDKKDISIGDPVGMVAAQSIGEPGTQLTMRTFHLGGTLSSSSDGSGNRIRSKKNGRVLILRRKILFGYSGKRVINRSSRIILLTSKHSIIQTIDIPYASVLNIDDGDYAEEKDILFSHNYYYTFTLNLYKGLLTQKLIPNDQEIVFHTEDVAYRHFWKKSHDILDKCLYPYLEKAMALGCKASASFSNYSYIDTPQHKKLDKITGILIKETKKIKEFDHEYAYIAKSLLQTYYPSSTYYIQTTINIEDTKKGVYGKDNLLELNSLEGDLVHIPSTPSYSILYPGRLLNQIPKDQSALSDITGGLTKIIRLFETVTTHQSLIATTNGFVLYGEKKSTRQNKKKLLDTFHSYNPPKNTYMMQEEKENSTTTKLLDPVLVTKEDFCGHLQKTTLSKQNLVDVKRQKEKVAGRRKKRIQYAQLHLKDVKLLNSLSISIALYKKRIYSSRFCLTDFEDHIPAPSNKLLHEELVGMSPLIRHNPRIQEPYVTIQDKFEEFHHYHENKMPLEDSRKNEKKSIKNKNVKNKDFQKDFLISNMRNRDRRTEKSWNRIRQGIKDISLLELQPFYEYTSQLIELYPTFIMRWIESRKKQNIKNSYKEFFPHSFLYENPYITIQKSEKYLSIYLGLLPFYNYLISTEKDKQKDTILNTQEIRFPRHRSTNIGDSALQNSIRPPFDKLNPLIGVSNDQKDSSIRYFSDFLSFTIFGFLTFILIYTQKEKLDQYQTNNISLEEYLSTTNRHIFIRYLLDFYFYQYKGINEKLNTSNDKTEGMTSSLFKYSEKNSKTSYLICTSSKDPMENLLKSFLMMAIKKTKMVDKNRYNQKSKDVRHRLIANNGNENCNSSEFIESQKRYYLLMSRLFYWFFSLYFEVICQDDLQFQKLIINQLITSSISDLDFDLDLNQNDLPKLQSFVEIQMEENRIQQKYNRKKEDYKVRSHDYLSKGDIITDENGLIPVSDAFLFLGFNRAIHQFMQQILQTYNESGVSIHIKHLEIVTLPLTSYVYIHTRNNDLRSRRIYNRLPIKSAYKSILRSAAHTSFYKVPKVFPSIKSLTSVCLHGDSVLGNASFQKPDFILGVIGIGTIDNPYYFQTHLFFSSLIPIGTGYIR